MANNENADELGSDQESCDASEFEGIENDFEAEPNQKRWIAELKGMPQILSKAHITNYLLYDIFSNKLKMTLPCYRKPREKGIQGNKDGRLFLEFQTESDYQQFLDKIGDNYTFVEEKGRKHTLSAQPAENMKFPVFRIKEPLDLETALDIFYKFRKMPYEEQLKQKTEQTKQSMMGTVTNLKKVDEEFAKTIETRNIPEVMETKGAPVTEGYSTDCTFHIEFVPPLKRVVAGVRVVENSKETIIPIEQCLHVPRKVVSVVKDFTENLKSFGFRAFNRHNDTGNVAGVQVLINKNEEIMMTVYFPREDSLLKTFNPVLVPRFIWKEQEMEVLKPPSSTVPKDQPKGQKDDEFDYESLEDPFVTTTPNLEAAEVSKDREHFPRKHTYLQPNLRKYFHQRGKQIGIVGIYYNWVTFSRSSNWVMHKNFPDSVVGAKMLNFSIMGSNIELSPNNNWLTPTVNFENILDAISLLADVKQQTVLALSSVNNFLAALYFGNKCKHVLSLHSWIGIQSGFETQKKIVFERSNKKVACEFVLPVDYNLSVLNATRFFLEKNAERVAVLWGFLRKELLIRLCNIGVKKIIIVWNASNNIVPEFEEYLKVVAPEMAPTKVMTFDTQPHGGEYVMLCLLERVTEKKIIADHPIDPPAEEVIRKSKQSKKLSYKISQKGIKRSGSPSGSANDNSAPPFSKSKNAHSGSKRGKFDHNKRGSFRGRGRGFNNQSNKLNESENFGTQNMDWTYGAPSRGGFSSSQPRLMPNERPLNQHLQVNIPDTFGSSRPMFNDRHSSNQESFTSRSNYSGGGSFDPRSSLLQSHDRYSRNSDFNRGVRSSFSGRGQGSFRGSFPPRPNDQFSSDQFSNDQFSNEQFPNDQFSNDQFSNDQFSNAQQPHGSQSNVRRGSFQSNRPFSNNSRYSFTRPQ